jgi:hypothetical protein
MWQARNKLKFIYFLIVFLGYLFIAKDVVLAEYLCKNRYVTLVNPVRGRDLWVDKTLNPITEQYSLIKSYNFPATWLIQYDVLKDSDVINKIQQFDNKQELGVFLEISPTLANDARVVYPHAVAWDDPNAIFLSGYKQSERRLLIDKLFTEFEIIFGNYPKSVGAWWIDSYSLEYMDKRFDIDTVLIVADQKTTDDYGVWGQWWGVPYRPTKENLLIPADSIKNAADYIVIQWAQRDLNKAYGEGLKFSNYSLQANDYTERGLTTDYFNNLIASYSDCGLAIGQITVGLETGIESVRSFPEYKNQLLSLSKDNNINSVTMSEFAQKYKNVYPNNPSEIRLGDSESTWLLTPYSRVNENLKENTIYQQGLTFPDYYLADNSKFLDRRLPINHGSSNRSRYPLFALLAFIVGALLFKKKKLIKFYIPISLFILSSFMTLFKSFSNNGWNVFFGPVVDSIPALQFKVVVISFLIFVFALPKLIKKLKQTNLLIWLLPLSFSLDAILYYARYTFMDGKHYVGFSLDSLKFLGISLAKFDISPVFQDFPSAQAEALLRFPFEDIWNNQFLSFIVYPLIHILIAAVLWVLLKRLPRKFQKVIILITIILYLLFIKTFLSLDPRAVN